MSEKVVIVHQAAIKEWGERDNPPIDSNKIQSVLAHIRAVMEGTAPQDLIVVEESASTGFPDLADKVGEGNSVRLMGARAGYCLAIARDALVGRGIDVTLDQEGTLA